MNIPSIRLINHSGNVTDVKSILNKLVSMERQSNDRIYRGFIMKTVKEVKGRTTREPSIYEVTGFNKSQHLSNHHKNLLNEHDNKKERTQKVNEIKKLYDEYKEGME